MKENQKGIKSQSDPKSQQQNQSGKSNQDISKQNNPSSKNSKREGEVTKIPGHEIPVGDDQNSSLTSVEHTKSEGANKGSHQHGRPPERSEEKQEEEKQEEEKTVPVTKKE